MQKEKYFVQEGHLYSLVALLFVLILCPKAQGSIELPSYYPISLKKALENHEPSSTIRQILHDTLKKAHIRQANQSDELAEQCLNPGDCYQHRALNYRYARHQLFGDLHLLKKAGHFLLKGVYCSKELGENDFPKDQGPAPGRIPSHRVMNTEHTWPQSRFSKRYPKDLQKGDLHILFPVQSSVNSTRSNLPFGEVSEISQQPCRFAKRGHNGRGTLSFEPADEHKGNVARALFYFSVRYELPIDPTQEDTLRKWAHEDPVDDFERERNQKIFLLQGNRNPFIDQPLLHSHIQDF